MNIGKYIFAQVIDFIPCYQFDKLVKKYKGDWHAKDLSCYNQLLHLLFGQITGCVYIRDICLCLEAHGSSIYHFGIRKSGLISSINFPPSVRLYLSYHTFKFRLVNSLYSNSTNAESLLE